MRFTALLSAIAIVAVPVLGANFNVTVGANDDFIFLPDQISGVLPGDTITFTFVSRNHSATTTTFSNPCPPPKGGVGPNGFDTGFHDSASEGDPSVVVTIEDTEPHFVACMQAAGAHCHRGMTFAINPTEDLSYEEFLNNALNDPIQTF
ncbi:hypothetical protein D9758_000782 [Tetrapyrgos nigripes]|uniref:Uncharacterized protein n=1 Tax=Tetrapyrgos nigripes TaxID=182062 RepID=A0A8H5GZ38_9AGAR|nr:hypothetical protein D9758_000782 [Tetrapyrgos nigripes]